MATPSRRTSAHLIEQLAQQPHEFEFLQAVRIWRQWRKEQRWPNATPGTDDAPEREHLRFSAAASFTFGAAEISQAEGLADAINAHDPNARIKLEITFLSLIGAQGALPQPYTQLLLDRAREKDYSLRDFYNVFHHRAISFYYRAWEKYRHWASFERSQASPQSTGLGGHPTSEDYLTSVLATLIGLGLPKSALRKRLPFRDETLLYFAGYLAHKPRNAQSLERMLADYWQLPLRVLQFQGQWLQLSPRDQTSLVRDRSLANGALGVNALAGQRIWSVEAKFTIQVGPLGYADFQSFTPVGERLASLREMVRTYVGLQFDFDIQPILKAKEVPFCQLGDANAGGSRLGWNTWLLSQRPTVDATQPRFS